MKSKDNLILNSMFSELQNAPLIYHPSAFWDNLNRTHLSQINNLGFENFKRSVNMRYFNWAMLGIFAHRSSSVFQGISQLNFDPIFKSKFPNYKSINGARSFSYLSALIYKIYVAYLYDYVKSLDKQNLLNKINEPKLGNPFLIEYKNKLISQDLCNSILDYYHIINFISNQYINSNRGITIGEVGAGYGRLAYIFLYTLPQVKYCIIDIPPALYISQTYLSKLFPKEKIFYFRPFKKFSSIKNEFNSSKIKFIMPHQLKLMPDNYFQLFITISTLQEMNLPQIKKYLKQINKLCSGYFYTKQWKKSRVKDNNYICQKEYPFNKKWSICYQKTHPIQKMFFEALFKVK